MDKQVLLAALLGVLLVVAAVQAFQLAGISGQASAKVPTVSTTGAASSPVNTPASTGSQGSGLDSVPDMVGGC